MRVVLTTEIPVSRVAVFAEMAWMERRPELGLLCRAALGNGNRISIAVVQSVLPGLSEAGANNVVAWCRMLALCDGGGALTKLGEDVADTDEAPVPEQGVYGLWIAKHPVLGQRVLAVERLASDRDQRFESIKPLVVDPDRGKVFRSVLDGKERFMVRDLPTNHGQPGGLIGTTSADCRLRWTLDFDQERDQWQLDGMIEAPQGNGKHAMRPMQHEPESDGLDLWGLVSTWAMGPLYTFGRWDEKERRLAVAFDTLTAEERDSFCKTMQLPSVEIPRKGSYNDVTLEDVPVGPTSEQDAQRWAMTRFNWCLNKEPGYRSRAEVRDLFAQLTEDTPLEKYSPTLPSHDELLSQASKDKDPERFWSLAAPVDLSPFHVTMEELEPFNIGSPAHNATSVHPDVVRVPYRAPWSMRDFVDKLLSGEPPLRVLLCDKYVRGQRNLDALKLLVGALRKAHPDVEVEVWTDEKEASFSKINEITRGAARSYDEKFGREPLHDRYLLVIPRGGQGFGWQMSNSPLHARAEGKAADLDTQLKWKDLMATRVSADQLAPAFKMWLGGEQL